VLARAARQGLETLTASVLRENWPMLRLATKVGCTPRRSQTDTIEIAFDLNGTP